MPSQDLIKSPIQIDKKEHYGASFRAAVSKGKTGVKFTEEHKRHLSEAKKGKPSPLKGKKMSEEHKKKLSAAHIGKPHPHGGKPNFKTRGANCHLWKGGITPINSAIRHSIEYKLWRTAVFERDNYTCVWCNKRGGVLNADHIKPFARFPELRFAIDNGRTLCVPCHKSTDTYGAKAMKKYA